MPEPVLMRPLPLSATPPMRLRAPEFGATRAARPTLTALVKPMVPFPSWLLVTRMEPSPKVRPEKVALRSEPCASIVDVAKAGTMTALLI